MSVFALPRLEAPPRIIEGFWCFWCGSRRVPKGGVPVGAVIHWQEDICASCPADPLRGNPRSRKSKNRAG